MKGVVVDEKAIFCLFVIEDYDVSGSGAAVSGSSQKASLNFQHQYPD